MIFGRNRTVRHEQVSLPAELLEERDLEIAAEPLEQVFSDLVVVRGDEPLPPRELLPLRPPPNARPLQRRRPAPDEGRDVLADTATGPGDGAAPEATALPERGPEITETR